MSQANERSLAERNMVMSHHTNNSRAPQARAAGGGSQNWFWRSQRNDVAVGHRVQVCGLIVTAAKGLINVWRVKPFVFALKSSMK